MYGFLRPDHCRLSPEDRKDYYRYYCGQCGAIQKGWGYPWRALVSYDAAFMGLLLAAQDEEPAAETKAWCAVFPRKNAVADPASRPAAFAAAMAVLLFALRCEDDEQEGRRSWRKIVAGIGKSKVEKAKVVLAAQGFPMSFIKTVSIQQTFAEQGESRDIRDYAEPSARFLAEVFRWTAKITGCTENEDTLCRIGYHTGRLIYLADGCIDILDDIEKKEFNALMAAYDTDHARISPEASGEVTELAMASIAEIRTLMKGLRLKRYSTLIENVLLQGLPQTLHKRIEQSAQKLAKMRPLLLDYLPHTALAAALCLAVTPDAEAGRGWGTNAQGTCYRGDEYVKFYGCYFGENCCKSSSGAPCPICIWIESIFNPCVYFFTESKGESNCLCIMQVPKALVSVGLISIPIFGTGFPALGDIKRRIKSKREAAENRVREERIRQNNEYFRQATKELDSLENYFKTIPDGLAENIVPAGFRDPLNTILASQQAEDLTTNNVFQSLIQAKTAQLRESKIKLDNALNLKRQASEKCQEIKNRFDRSISTALPLYKELLWIHECLASEQHQSLIRSQQWDRYMEAVQKLMVEMDRLQEQFRNYQPPRGESFKKTAPALDHLPAKQLLLLLNACTDQRTILIDMALNDIVQTEAFRFGLHRGEYEFLTSRARKQRDDISAKDMDYVSNRNIEQLTLGRIMDLHRKLKELLALKERSEKTLVEGKTDDIDVIHRDWRNYLNKLQGKVV